LNEKDILCCLPSFNLKMKRIFGRREKGKEDLSVDAVVVQKENLVEQLSQQERKWELTQIKIKVTNNMISD